MVLQQERRYLLMMITAILNQKKAPALSNAQISWKSMYQTAESNQVAGLLYVGVLGADADIDKGVKGLFFESYQKELKNIPVYQKAEEALVRQFEKSRIHSMILEGSSLRDLYPHREMRKMDRIRVWVQKNEIRRMDGIMRGLDYEPCENREDQGILYYKPPGVYVAVYDKVRFVNKKLERFFDSPMWMFPRAGEHRCIHCLDKEESYIYMVGKSANEYALGRMGVRSVLDFWLYEKQHEEELNWPHIEKVLKKYKILEFSEHLLELGDIWFANGVSERMEIYNAMEAYIFSKGEHGRQISGKILPLLDDVADFYRRDRRGEWLNKRREWLFPPKEYMEGLFPILKKFPWLRPACWLIRWWRVGISLGKQSWKRKLEGVKEKLRQIKRQPGDMRGGQKNNIRME